MYFTTNIHKFKFFLISLSIFIIFLIIGGGAVTNDELKFLQFAYFNILPLDFIGRFGHIYLLKFFFFLDFPPHFTLVFVWALVVSSTNFFILILIFDLSKKSLFFSILGSLVFLSHTIIAKNIGALYSDTILMFCFTLFIFLSFRLIDLNVGKNKNIIKSYIFLSFIIFIINFSIITKPTGLVLIIPFLYIIYNLNIKFTNILILLILNIVIFLFFTFLIDYLITGNFLYKFDTLSLNATLENSLLNKKFYVEKTNWLSFILSSPLIYIFFNFIIWTQDKNDFNIKHSLIFLTIISLLLFLTIIVYFSPRIILRHFYPCFPLLCIVNILLIRNYFLKLNYSKLKLFIDNYLFFLIISFLISLSLIFYVLYNFPFDWSSKKIALYIIIPFFLFIILFKKIFNEFIYSFIIIFIFILNLFPFLILFPKHILYANKVYSDRVEPINYFIKNFSFNSGDTLLISEKFQFTENHAGREGLFRILTNNDLTIVNSGNKNLEGIKVFKYIIMKKNETLNNINITVYKKKYYKDYIYLFL